MKHINRWEDLCINFHEDFIDNIQCYNDKVEVRVSKWKITLDTSVVSSGKVSFDLTRMRARYKRLDNFKFNIYHKTTFDKFMDFFTKNEKSFDFGYPKFENDFVIKSNDKNKLESLLSNSKIMQIIESQPFMVFEIIDDEEHLGKEIAACMSEISLKVAGVIDDPKKLKCLFELFSKVLNQLYLLKSAC